jgi:deoxyribonuclease-4
MILGAHVSIGGGVYNAIQHAEQLDCETFQIFTKNQNQWKEKIFTDEETGRFKHDLEESRIGNCHLAAHASYLINLCSPDSQKLTQSRQAFIREIERCGELGLAFLIFHPGAHLGKGEQWATDTIAHSLIHAITATERSNVRLLLETTAGQGTNMGYAFEQLAQILELVNDDSRMGVCLDTCHVFAAGYDLRSASAFTKTMNNFARHIGMDHLYAFHLNDSKRELGSRVDRHERIGSGEIGMVPFQLLVNDERFKKMPGFLEVPGGDDAFKSDLELLKSFRK